MKLFVKEILNTIMIHCDKDTFHSKKARKMHKGLENVAILKIAVTIFTVCDGCCYCLKVFNVRESIPRPTSKT